jgi:hypothetical protein
VPRSPSKQPPSHYLEGTALRQRPELDHPITRWDHGSPLVAPAAPAPVPMPAAQPWGPTHNVYYGQSFPTRGDYPPSMTPEPARSMSYDSRASNYGPPSPVSPGPMWSHSHRPPPYRTDSSCSYYTNASAMSTPYETAYSDALPPQRLSYIEGPASIVSPASSTTSLSSVASVALPSPDKAPKRYPCKFRVTLNCYKTFTTSGHASRHSRIHTAEKAVQCRHPGCPKKFTRADNMKQHLETHNKDKPRPSTRQSTASERSESRQPMSFYHRSRSGSLSADSLEQDDRLADMDVDNVGNVQGADHKNTTSLENVPQRPEPSESRLDSLIRASALFLEEYEDHKKP